MDSTKRIIVNTAAQYTKAIINIGLSLYSVRLVLQALDISDYGIYSLIAGIVGTLGYLANAMVLTTQRYISFYHGSGNIPFVKKIFANSLLLHIIIACIFAVVLFAVGDLLIHHFFNIAPQRRDSALIVYYFTVLMLIITIFISPFKALLIARENIVYISIVEVADGFLKLFLAFSLSWISGDRLLFYSAGMGVVFLFNLVAFVIFCLLRYEESHVRLQRSTADFSVIKKLLGFASWTTYGMVAGICQTQGIAVILNLFYGTVVNAAYGLASQIHSAVRFVSTSILNAMNPQIMKAEGSGNHEYMLELAGKESKYSSALMLIVSIPVITELPSLLAFWLDEVPDYTVLFGQALMLAFLIDQLTLGLHSANQATGKIATYSVIMFTPTVLIVPVAYLFHCLGMGIPSVMILFVAVELGVAVLRIPFMVRTAGLRSGIYLRNVLLPLIPLCLSLCIVCLIISAVSDWQLRFLLTLPISGLCGLAALWRFTMDESERQYATQLIKRNHIRHEH